MVEKAARNASRRPLKSRSTRWANLAARAWLATGLGPNSISFLGILVALLGAWAMLLEPAPSPWFLAAAICIQLRLAANLLDGMVAIEGGRGGPTGAIWNEFPDRIEDSVLLVAAGYSTPYPWLGWLAALLAAVCAYVRMLGASLGQAQDFRGPMAKQHRMAALTLGCLAAIAWSDALAIALAVIAAGTAVTIALRIGRLARAVRA